MLTCTSENTSASIESLKHQLKVSESFSLTTRTNRFRFHHVQA